MMLLSTPVLSPSLASLVMLLRSRRCSQSYRSVHRWLGGLVLFASQQLIPHGTKQCLASINVGPAVLVRVPPHFIDLARKLKANVGTARVYALGTGQDVMEPNTSHWLALKDWKTIIQCYGWGEAKMCHHTRLLQSSNASTMKFPCTMGKLKTGQESTTHLYSNVSISSKSLLEVKATSPLNSNSSILTTPFCSSLSPRLLASLYSSKILSLVHLSQ